MKTTIIYNNIEEYSILLLPYPMIFARFWVFISFIVSFWNLHHTTTKENNIVVVMEPIITENKKTFEEEIHSVQITPNRVIKQNDEPSVLTEEEKHLWDEKVWPVIQSKISPEALKWLTFDLKIRYMRGSAYLTKEKKRIEYLVPRVSEALETIERLKPHQFFDDPEKRNKYPKWEIFQKECWPMKIYGNDSTDRHPIFGIRVASADLKKANEIFDVKSGEVLTYFRLHVEAQLKLVKQQSKMPQRNNPDEYILPTHDLILDLDGASISIISQLYKLGVQDLAQMLSGKFEFFIYLLCSHLIIVFSKLS
jgi:hypothetical protein